MSVYQIHNIIIVITMQYALTHKEVILDPVTLDIQEMVYIVKVIYSMTL